MTAMSDIKQLPVVMDREHWIEHLLLLRRIEEWMGDNDETQAAAKSRRIAKARNETK